MTKKAALMWTSICYFQRPSAIKKTPFRNLVVKETVNVDGKSDPNKTNEKPVIGSDVFSCIGYDDKFLFYVNILDECKVFYYIWPLSG